MKKINKIINIVLIFTLIGMVLCLDFANSQDFSALRVSLSAQDVIKKRRIRMAEIAGKIKKVRETEIEITIGNETKRFPVTKWVEAFDWICESHAINSLIGYALYPLDENKKAPFLFCNSLEIGDSGATQGIIDAYNNPIMRILRSQVVDVALAEWKLKWEFLKELIGMLGLQEYCLIDLAQGANPTSCIGSDIVIGINSAPHPLVRQAFIRQYGGKLGLSLRQLNKKTHFEIGDITKPEDIQEALQHNKKYIQQMPKVWFLNSMASLPIYEDSVTKWPSKINSLIKVGDLLIFSGDYPDRLIRSFLESGEYEYISPDLTDIIFRERIAERFYIYAKRDFQYIFTLGHIEILIKKGGQSNHNILEALEELERIKRDSISL